MKAGQILKLAGHNYIGTLPAHLREDVTKQLNVVLAAAETFNTDMAVNDANADLSPEGRSAGSARVAAAALATLTAIEATTIKTLTDRTVSLEQALLSRATTPAPTDPAERLSYEMHLQEIRAELRGLSLIERTNVYRTSTDPATLAAMDSAPMTLSAPRQDGSRRLEHFIDPAERQVVALARAEAADPATASTLREVRSLREVYTHAVNGVRKEILDEVPQATPEPVLTIV